MPLPVITAALYARFASRQDDSPAMKVVAALRNQFGGHSVKSADAQDDGARDEPLPDVTPSSGAAGVGAPTPLQASS